MNVRVGASPRRVGGHARVTGGQRYTADIRLPDVLHVKLVTLPAARARILSIDASAAEQIPGVRLVMTAADLPDPMPRFGPQFDDRPVIAVGETKYHGEPVAAVAADTTDAAEAAAGLVKVEYEELPAVFAIEAALAPDAPLVQDPGLRLGDPLAQTNVLREHRIGWGDLKAARADLVVEHTYRFPMVTHFAIEPHAFMAAPDGDGIAVWTSIQHPYWLQKILSKVLGLPLSRVRVLAPDPGGAFGGKQHVKFEPLMAFMAMRAGRPVRLVLTLEETFQAARRAAAKVDVRTGLLSDGTIAFQDIAADYLIGAYADIADRVVGKGSYVACGPYRVPSARIVGRSILSHTTPSTAFRGFGNPQVNWAVESNLDEGAIALGIDRLAIRLRNLARRGEAFIPFDTPADGEWQRAVERAAAMIAWDTPVLPGRGRGIALGIKAGPTTGLSYSTVRLLADGSVIVYAGTSDMGQGARTIFAQIAGDELGAPLDWVTVVMGDTAVVPYDQQTSASRSTVLMGNAVLNACHDIHAKLRVMVARLSGLEESDIVVEKGVVRLPDRELTIADVLRTGLGPRGGEIIGNGEMRREDEPGHPLGGSAAFFEFNCTAVEAEVDVETGDILLHKHVTVSDVGKALNPLQVRMQDEGAAIMGLGHTLMEHLIHDESGRIRNLGAIDYRIPTSMDLPIELASDMVENEDGPGPYGAKGMSEGALLGVASAVASAVRDATGAVIRDLPLSPERVWRALQERPYLPEPEAGDSPRPEKAPQKAPVSAHGAAQPHGANGPANPDLDTLLSTLAIKGAVASDALAEALNVTPEGLGSLMASQAAEGLVELSAGLLRLTLAGRDAASRTFAADRMRLGSDRGEEVLDSFKDLDQRMKEIVTAWQLREVGGSHVANDHRDQVYDREVLDRLEVLHGDTMTWLATLVARVARYGLYRGRLDRAARLAAAGDARFIASPRVDSYHSVWFELHEDLILLCGRTRADEVAAGRA